MIERSVAAPATHDDAYIERWAVVYQSTPWYDQLQRYRVSFEAFLIAPELILALIQTDLQRPVPVRDGLLPAQRQIQLRVDLTSSMQDVMRLADATADLVAERDRAYASGGRLVIKMAHRAWPRSWSRGWTRKHQRDERAA